MASPQTAEGFIQLMNRISAGISGAAAQGDRLVGVLNKVGAEASSLSSKLNSATSSIKSLTESAAGLTAKVQPAVKTINDLASAIDNLFQLIFGIPVDDPPEKPNIKKLGAQLLINAGRAAFSELSEIIKASISGAMEEHTVKSAFIARAGGAALGEPLYQNIRERALELGVAPNDATQTGYKFLSTAKTTEQAERLTNMAMEISLLQPGGGNPQDVANAINQAMKGNYSNLAGQFQINIDDLKEVMNDTDMNKIFSEDDMDGFISKLDLIREKANMGKDALDLVSASPAAQISTIQNLLKSGFAEAGMGAVNAFSPLLAKLNEILASEKFQVFFNILGNGLTQVAQLFSVVAQAALWLFEQFLTYWPAIAAVFLMISSLFLPQMLAALWAMLAPLWAMIAPILIAVGAWIAANWPILVIILIIGILIGLMIHFGTTVGEVVGFVTGTFAALFALIHNSIASLWNDLLGFIEFLTDAFNGAVFAIESVIYTVFTGLVTFAIGLINKIADHVNELITLINKVAKTSISTIGTFTVNTQAFGPPPTPPAKANYSNLKMGMKDVGDEFNKGFKWGENLTNKASSGLKGFMGKLNDKSGLKRPDESMDTSGNQLYGNPALAGGMSPDINRVNEVGSIDEKVDISSEDLKTMRELAEMKNIQNFVSLQPTVSVQTGDINNGMDVDTIIGRIERVLSDQIASSAEGVYG